AVTGPCSPGRTPKISPGRSTRCCAVSLSRSRSTERVEPTEPVRLADHVEVSRPPAPLIRNVAFQLLWVSRFVARIAKEAADVAYPLLILATTGSATYAGAVGAIELAVAGFVAITGGSLADLVDRRKLLVTCDIARLVMLALFGILVATHRADVPMV